MSTTTHLPDTDCLAYTAADLARVLHVSRRHVWSLHSRGLLPRPIRLSRSARWVRSEVEAWLSAGCPPRDRWEELAAQRSLPCLTGATEKPRDAQGWNIRMVIHINVKRAIQWDQLAFWAGAAWVCFALLLISGSALEGSPLRVPEVVQLALLATLPVRPFLSRLAKAQVGQQS